MIDFAYHRHWLGCGHEHAADWASAVSLAHDLVTAIIVITTVVIIFFFDFTGEAGMITSN